MEVNEFIEDLGGKPLESFTKIGNEFFLIPENLKKVQQKIKDATGRDPYSIGTYLGKMNKTKFEPSIALLDIIAETSDKKVTIDDKAAWLFVCGRDVFVDSIKIQERFKGPSLVCNEKGEILGYGIRSHMGNIGIKNIFDKGNFIRREKRRTKYEHTSPDL